MNLPQVSRELEILLYNIWNSIGLGADVSGTAVELWRSLMKLYDKWSEVAKLHAEEQLKSLQLYDSNDFPSYIAQLRLFWQKVNSIGGIISDVSFHTIIFSLLLY